MSPTIIYVVEDDPAAGKSLEAVVRSLGYEAILFDSAESFLDSIDDQTSPGCLITDIRLPGKSGLDLLEELAHYDVFFASIVVSAYASTPLTVRALQAGAITVLDKPYSPQQLAESIELALESVRERHETHARMEEVRRRLAKLTCAEHQILTMLIEGKPNKAMASKLKLSTRTIENRRRQLYEKMKTYSVPELVRMVVELNLHDERTGHKTIT